MLERKSFFIQGIVQGVGFRPFVFRLAQSYCLAGWVANDENGVEIEIEGEVNAVKNFITALVSNPPPQSRIYSIKEKSSDVLGDKEFYIKPTLIQGNETVFISPDLALCPDCLAELHDPINRRYHYPFINCTNCGPRYTIILDVPYDRPLTTMKDFTMCVECEKEYNEPSNRRFHAQPNACPVCGPYYWLLPGDKKLGNEKTIALAKKLLLEGHTLAIKGLGGFHLAADACLSEAVNKLRAGKNREYKPLAVMVNDIAMAEKFCEVYNSEANLLSSTARPIVLLKIKDNNYLAKEVALNQNYYGIMLPYTPLHYLLLEDYPHPLIMTSGNLSEESIVYQNEDAKEHLGKLADYFLLHNRYISIPCDDSVVRVINDRRQILRRSRGYVPAPISVSNMTSGILAVGAEERNTICLTKAGQAFLSHHLSDLKNMRSYEAFEKAIEHLKKILGIKVRIAAYDLHPEYLSTKYASFLKEVKKVGIQHHFAHIAGCMAEYGLKETVIGLAMDGGGYGIDETIWGGEVLLVSPQAFEREGHLISVPLPGGSAAVKEPWRMTLSYLYCTFGPKFWDLKLEFLNKVERESWPIFQKMLERRLNSPLTTSMGRFFDAVSALLGICSTNTYSGQAAMELEMIAGEGEALPFKYKVIKKEEGFVLDQLSIFHEIVAASINKEPEPLIALRFHYTLAYLFKEIAERLRETYGINKVCLAGGVFQNKLLLTITEKVLQEKDFLVYWSRETPVNDGGISLGQAWIASNLEER